MKNNAGLESSIFATTALVAFAGAAAAQSTISGHPDRSGNIRLEGSAEMGIAGGSGTTPTTFFQSVDVRFSLSGTTDNGLSFGAVVDLEDATDRNDGLVDRAGAFADFTVFVSGDFGRLTMGDTDGAFDWAVDELNAIRNAGSIADNETGHAGYLNAGGADSIYNGQQLRYEYSIGGFGVAVSAEVDGSATRDGDAVMQIGLAYDLEFAGGELNLGLGYASVSDANRRAVPTGVLATSAAGIAAINAAGAPIAGDQGFSSLGLSAIVALDAGLSIGVNYLDVSDDGFYLADGEYVGVGIGYNFDAITVSANFGEFDWGVASNQADSEGYGLAAQYNLGGGLSAHLGYGESKVTAVNASGATVGTSSTFSLGLSMAF
ncbi:porin [Roseicyclus marinus]|uniref:porin n=1 Tax=Roseicyclus marinus TaxID=2161673 RepID=UPI002410836D|nr:porin [Roseicyclus marinus]MDG3042529.1 porin [Roseicyclus marinus]